VSRRFLDRPVTSAMTRARVALLPFYSRQCLAQKTLTPVTHFYTETKCNQYNLNDANEVNQNTFYNSLYRIYFSVTDERDHRREFHLQTNYRLQTVRSLIFRSKRMSTLQSTPATPNRQMAGGLTLSLSLS